MAGAGAKAGFVSGALLLEEYLELLGRWWSRHNGLAWGLHAHWLSGPLRASTPPAGL